jgi:two-component system cell cycle response regulator
VESVELLRQNLTVEPDLQNFSGFVLESVNRLGGSPFSASIALLDLMQQLRGAGAASGYPLSAGLSLCGDQLLVHWGDHCAKVADIARPPSREVVERLRQHLQNSTALTDPDILLQRNTEMMRHLDETRVRTEKELAELQQALEKRQAELQESMHQAETDPLTGLLNRRAFDEKLARIFRHTMRQRGTPLSLLLFDLDHFKEINDAYGHQFGDAHLNKMAHILRGAIREDVDFAFRFGGDEFAVLIFADYPLAFDKAKQVLQLMEYKVSIGITTINADTPDDLSLEEFIHRADNALYEAKHRGRGQAVVDVLLIPDEGDASWPEPAASNRG